MNINNIDLDDVLKRLEELAKTYDNSSPYQEVLELAAHAIVFVAVKAARKEFMDYLSRRNQPMTEQQRARYEHIALEDVYLSNKGEDSISLDDSTSCETAPEKQDK